MKISDSLSHLLVGLATIGALSALAANGTIPGSEALASITGIAGVLLGTGASAMGSSSTMAALMTPPPIQSSSSTPAPTPPPIQ